MDGNIIPHSKQEKDAISPMEFVQKLDALKPKEAAGHILLGQQHENGGISPTGFSGPIDVDRMTHINTGVFTMNPQSGWTERTVDCQGTFMLVLDDVGEKTTATPTVEPTFKIRTKPGSEQWGYVYNEPVSPEMGAGMATAAADAGLSDPYISRRAHYWSRLPESLPPPKIKERYAKAEETGQPVDLTPAKLVLWTGHTFAYSELAAALGLDPQAEDVDGYSGSVKYDAETGDQDPILQFLEQKGRVRKKRPDASGWRDVFCPNYKQHSDQKKPWARYVPPNKDSRSGFMCHHGHCTEVKLADLRKAVEAWGGPTAAESKGHALRVQPNPNRPFEERVGAMPAVTEPYVPPVAVTVEPKILLPMGQDDVAREMLRPLVDADEVTVDANMSRIMSATGMGKGVLERQLSGMRREQQATPARREQHTEIVNDFIVVNGSVVGNSKNIGLMISRGEWEEAFAYDIFRNRPVVMRRLPGDPRVDEAGYPRPLNDGDYLHAHMKMQGLAGWHKVGKHDVIDAVEAVCAQTRWHPIRQYLENLPAMPPQGLLDSWLLRFLKCNDDADYLLAVGRAWLIGAVARVMNPGCQMDNALVLEGPQGYGKSTALRILAGDEFFGDSLPDFHDKAASEYLPGKWIIEMAELTGLRRSEVENMRSFLTRREESFRPAYGRQVVNFKRQCIFAGSTNRDDYLTDPDGERRFWIVKVAQAIDTEGLLAHRDALWKEAYDAYVAGEPWCLTGAAVETATAIQKDRVTEDAWTDILTDRLGSLQNTCVRQCREMLSGMGHNTEKGDTSHRIGRCLKSLGFVKEEKKRRFSGYPSPVHVWNKRGTTPS